MKKIIFTFAAFGLLMTGLAQNTKPTGNEPDPDSLQQKANYNTTRTSKTIKDPKSKIKKEEKKGSEVKTEKSGGGQSVSVNFTLLPDKKRFQRDIK